MQIALVLITFLVAVGFLLRKFIWMPIYETRRPLKNGNGAKNKCGNTNCGCS